MNVIGGSIIVTLAIWVIAAIAIVVAMSYFLRPRTRALYPGGNRRYLMALIIQSAGFMLPIPFVLIMLLGRPIPEYFDIVIAVAAGLAVIFGLRMLPVVGPMLKDLQRARIQAVAERLGPAPERKP